MTPEKLDLIAAKSADNLKILVGDSRDHINAAIVAATEQAQEEGTDAVKITLSHSIVIDIGKEQVQNSLGVSVRHKLSIKEAMPDPNQPQLELDDED